MYENINTTYLRDREISFDSASLCKYAALELNVYKIVY